MEHQSSFQPHIASSQNLREFSLRALAAGVLFGLFCAVAKAYLALKVGQTVSASIPAAVLSMGLMRFFFKNVTILEHNIVQTVATVGEGLAAGVVFTIPALFFLGDMPSIGRIFLLSALGGILGILLMIPMRRFLIVEEHRKLPFPEGTACAELLKCGERSGKSALMAAWGVLIAGGYKVFSSITYCWKESPEWIFRSFQGASFSIDATPALLGVGYIIGSRISAMMFAGGVAAWWVIIPLIKLFGQGSVMIYPSTTLISAMSSSDIWSNYVRYIGAGTVAIGGLISLFRIAPLLFKAIRVGISELLGGLKTQHLRERTDRDISMAWLILGSLAILLALWLNPNFSLNFFTVALLLVLAFFFVAVTSLTVGIVGSSSNPVSGMTITTLFITCVIFVMLGWTERAYLISAITMGCVSCVAICLAATTSQDLKTGFLLGATPRSQQLAEIIGIVLPSLALGYTVYILNQAYHIGSEDMPAPQAVLLSIIAKGVIGGDLPYTLVIIGVLIGLVIAILEVPILPFALGLYLPLSLTAATMVGGLVRWFIDRKTSTELVQERGILLASGLVGGDALMGIVVAALTIAGIIPADAPSLLPDWVSLTAFLGLGVAVMVMTLYRHKEGHY